MNAGERASCLLFDPARESHSGVQKAKREGGGFTSLCISQPKRKAFADERRWS